MAKLLRSSQINSQSNLKLQDHLNGGNEDIKVVPRDTIQGIGGGKVLNHLELLKQVAIIIGHNQVHHNGSEVIRVKLGDLAFSDSELSQVELRYLFLDALGDCDYGLEL